MACEFHTREWCGFVYRTVNDNKLSGPFLYGNAFYNELEGLNSTNSSSQTTTMVVLEVVIKQAPYLPFSPSLWSVGMSANRPIYPFVFL